MESVYCPHSVPTTETILASSHVHPSFPLSTRQFILLFGCISKVSCECQFTSPLNPSVGISLTILWFFCFRGKICLQWNSQILNALFGEFWQLQSRVTKPLLRYGTWICFFRTESCCIFLRTLGEIPMGLRSRNPCHLLSLWFLAAWKFWDTFVACFQHVYRTCYAFLCHLTLPSLRFPCLLFLNPAEVYTS